LALLASWQPVIDLAVVAVGATTDQYSRAQVLADLVLHLPADQLPQAPSRRQHHHQPDYRARALADLAPHLPADPLPEALTLGSSLR